MAESSTAVARATKETVKKWLDNPQMQNFIRRVLPNEIDAAKVLQIYYNVISSTPALQDCTPTSLMKVILFGSQLGLSFDPNLRQAWIVPYGKVATLIVGYKGLEKLVIQSGYVDAIDAVTVYENDEFEIEEGETPRLHHKPRVKGDRGKSIGVYARGFRPDGKIRFRFVPLVEIEKHRNAGASKNSPAWKEWGDEMAEKTAIRIFCKRLPQNEKTMPLHRLISADEMAEAAPEQQGAGLIDADEVIDVESEPEQEKVSRTAAVKDQLKKATKEAEKSAAQVERDEQWGKTITALESVSKNEADADIKVSEALGGKIQSKAALVGATIEQLKQVETHCKVISDE